VTVDSLRQRNESFLPSAVRYPTEIQLSFQNAMLQN